MRSLRIVSVGISKNNGRPWAKAAADATSDEQLLILKAGVDPQGSVFGFVRGIPDISLAKLTPGDVLTGEFAAKITPSTYEVEGEVKACVNAVFFATGSISRSPAAMAICDW